MEDAPGLTAIWHVWEVETIGRSQSSNGGDRGVGHCQGVKRWGDGLR
jgi:hypothetical protein